MITLIHGPAELRRAEALAGIRTGLAADPGLADLNTVVLDGRQAGPSDLQFACNTLPFLAERRLVVVERLLARVASGSKRGKKGDAGEGQEPGGEETGQPVSGQGKAWQAVLEQVPESTELVLVEDELVSAGALWRLLQELVRAGRAHIITCVNPRRGRELQDWIQERTKSYKLQLEGPAVADLAEFVGDDLRQLDQELRKLRDYVGGERRVTQSDVRRLVAATRAANVFEMVDALAAGNAAQAGRQLQHALDVDGEQALGLIALLARRYRQLIQARALQSAGAGKADIMSQLGLPDWQAGKLLEQASRQSLPRLQRSLEHLLAADESIKTGKCTDREAMDILLAELALDSAR